jgi:hypothetical protein
MSTLSPPGVDILLGSLEVVMMFIVRRRVIELPRYLLFPLDYKRTTGGGRAVAV